MKRALAERAKQQSIPQAPPLSGSGNATSSSPDQTVGSQPPPSKVPRLQVPPSTSSSSTNVKPTTTTSSSSLKSSSINKGSSSNRPSATSTTATNKNNTSSGGANSGTSTSATPSNNSSSVQRNNRIKALTSAVAADGDNQDNAFYLKHQNRALATELKSLQFAVSQLEHEREYRRQQCSAACQALNSLQATWTQLETVALSSSPSSSASPQQQQLLPHETTPPAATGTGANAVEWTRALAQALASLASSSAASSQQQPPPTSVEQLYADLSHLSANVADRASVLQEHLLKTVQQQQTSAAAAAAASNGPSSATAAASAALQNNNDNVQQLLQHQVAELAAARDAVTNRERKLRRNVYRLAAGMLSTEQVIRQLDNSAEGGENSSYDDDVRLQVQAEAAAAQAATVKQEEQQLPLPSQSSSGDQQPSAAAQQHQQPEGVSSSSATTTTTAVSAQAAERWQGQIETLQKSVAHREETIQDLNAKLKEKELEINRLTVRQKTDEDGEKLKSLQATQMKLETKEKTVQELESKLTETRKEWALTLANEKKLQAALEEQLGKFQKRWSEFTNALGETDDAAAATTTETTNNDTAATDSNAETTVPSLAEQVSQSKRIIELQHKLNQAIENVRQAESTRSDLADALQMNKQLQSELEEIKGKYTALQASRSAAAAAAAAAAASEAGNHNSSAPGNSSKEAAESSSKSEKSSEKPSGESSSKYERMHRDYRRARKELAAMTASKDSAKSKLERSEKERENLVETNARLLRQSTEKDEMNAKSLATILHLKSLTEQLTAERGNLEQQVKSASQLALAARLATNAKERVTEEASKEKEQFEQKCKQLEQEHATTKTELAKIKHDWSEESGERTSLSTQLSNALKRSDDLVAENQTKADELRKLRDATEKAQREARDATEKLNAERNSNNGGGGGTNQTAGIGGTSSSSSAFTVDQLNTQISVLKGRLACPVCHYRDKECIIMRCRHMHCKQCVDERISNRSRKCPTCNNKFSEKDVEDVWLS